MDFQKRVKRLARTCCVPLLVKRSRIAVPCNTRWICQTAATVTLLSTMNRVQMSQIGDNNHSNGADTGLRVRRTDWKAARCSPPPALSLRFSGYRSPLRKVARCKRPTQYRRSRPHVDSLPALPRKTPECCGSRHRTCTRCCRDYRHGHASSRGAWFAIRRFPRAATRPSRLPHNVMHAMYVRDICGTVAIL